MTKDEIFEKLDYAFTYFEDECRAKVEIEIEINSSQNRFIAKIKHSSNAPFNEESKKIFNSCIKRAESLLKMKSIKLADTNRIGFTQFFEFFNY
jgi:hypothetical protein